MTDPRQADLARAVGAVADPEIRRSLAELGMLRRVHLDRRGVAHVEVALTTASCPLAEEIRAGVQAAATSVPGVERCELTFTALAEHERMALAESLHRSRPHGPPAPRVYAVASGKGGVGKSTVTANLAVALAAAGQRVGLLDADVWGYSVPQLFGVRRAPVALKGLMLPVEAYGVRLMSVGFLVDDDEPVMWRGPMLHKALEQFLADVWWGELDVLLLDLPPGTGDVTLSLLELLPEAALLAVTTPQPAAQRVAARVGRMAQAMRMPVAGVVENMSVATCEQCGHAAPLFGADGGRLLAEQLQVPLLGQVPLDLAAREAGDAGVPVVRRSPQAASALELARIAGALPTVRRSLVGVPLPLSVG